MSTSFDGQHGLIVVSAEVFGLSGSAILRLALDTGATSTVVIAQLLAALGYDLNNATEQVEVTTGSRIESVPHVLVDRIATLGEVRRQIPILGLTIPPSAGVDGVLGLDFFRGCLLTIDFNHGQLALVQQSSNPA